MGSSTPNPMNDLYRRLSALGFTKPYVRERLLPDWWDDEIASRPSGFAEALAYLSRFTGLDMASLRDRSRSPEFRPMPTCRFKKIRTTSESELSLARAMATRAAQLVGA